MIKKLTTTADNEYFAGREVVIVGEILVIYFEDPQNELIHSILKLVDKQQPVSIFKKPALTMTFGELKILVEERRVLVDDIEIRLSVKEFDALVYLASSSGRVFTKAQIYYYLYDDAGLEEIDNIIYCLIRSLRKKLESDLRHPRYIHTVRGVGYKFEVLPGE